MMWRYRTALFLLVGGFFLIILRLFYWQVVRAEELSSWGKSQYATQLKIFPKRGEIRTSDGYPIATNNVSYLVFINPKEVGEKEKIKTTTILSSFLQIDSASVSGALKKDLYWVPLRNNISPELKEKIELLKLTGVGFEEQSIRFYPEASLAAHLIGFVGKDEAGDNKGYFGVEGYYDRQLRGKAGNAVFIKDAFGRPILAKADDKESQIDGRSLILSIDRVIQFIAENKLKKGLVKYGAVGGAVVIMNPKTGNILAIASFPSFDPSSYQEFDSTSYKNPAVSNLFEPGSTFKSLIMSAGIDAKVVKPDTKCPICAGPVAIGEYQVRTWNNEYHKDVTMTDVIKNSDNIGMVYVSQELGIEKMLEYFEKFGIGSLTGIDLQGETVAELKPRNQWYPIDIATASFGQGISITPIMLLTAFSSIANEGKRMEPHVVAKIETAKGEIIEIKPKMINQPISSETAKVMKEILVKAASQGEAKFASVKGYRIAGKTGTAQIPIAGHYDPNKTIASFIGFAPADDPKFAMLVVVDKPTSSIYGSETAAPIFFDIASDLFTYYNIAPTE